MELLDRISTLPVSAAEKQKLRDAVTADRETAPFYALWREHVPASPMVKEGNFFREQKGLVEDWGRAWTAINAASVGDARRVIAAIHGERLSNLYWGET